MNQNETPPKTEVNEVAQVLGKRLLIIGSEMQNVFDFSWNITVIIVQSGLKLYNFTIVATGVEANKFVICSHNGFITGLFDRTEDRIWT